MSPLNTTTDSTPQRWARPLNFPPGHWKKQLPTRNLNIAAHGDMKAIEELLAEHPEYLNKRGSHNRTLLWEASRRGKLAAAQWLVEHGAEIDATGSVNHESYVQLTPYCAAVFYHKQEVESYLLSQGTHLDIFRAAFLGNRALVAAELNAHPEMIHVEDPHDNIYYVPLIAFAIVGEHIVMVEELLARGAHVAPYSAQLLYLAARRGRFDIVELIVSKGAEVISMEPLIFTAVNDMHIFRYLLEHGADVNRMGMNGFPPLIYVARGDKGESPEKVKTLIEHGATVNATNQLGKTALHYAAAAGYLDVIEILLDHGADPNLRDRAGKTARDLALAGGKTAAFTFLTR